MTAARRGRWTWCWLGEVVWWASARGKMEAVEERGAWVVGLPGGGVERYFWTAGQAMNQGPIKAWRRPRCPTKFCAPGDAPNYSAIQIHITTTGSDPNPTG